MNRRTGQRVIRLNTRLLFVVMGLLLLSCLTVGITSYDIARRALNDKGKTILKNSVEMALLLIDTANASVLSGRSTLESAQERVKQQLSSVRSPEGKRQHNTKIDLGKSGYFIVYSRDGVELLHPTLEGQNVWDVRSKGGSAGYLVRDQIEKGLAGGGFSWYTWNYPDSEKLGAKLTYSKLDPHWNWIVVSSAYLSDHNADARKIQFVTAIASIVLLLLGGVLASFFIKGITNPLAEVIQGMEQAGKGNYSRISASSKTVEMVRLCSGFNNMVAAIGSAQDELMSQDEKIRKFAYYDRLSGLPNNNKFKEYVSGRMEVKSGQGCLALMAIKDFKAINSIYGTAYGDAIIKQIGDVLAKLGFSMIAKYEWNEFAFWLESTSPDTSASSMVNRIAKVPELLAEGGLGNRIEFITGFSVFPRDGSDFDSCYKNAGIALRHAKNNGIKEIREYRSEFSEKLEREEKIKTIVEHALAQDEFKLNYQNKIDLVTRKIVGVEALARLHSAALGHIPPSDFIPAITKANLMNEFSAYIFKKALDDFPKLQAKFHSAITVSINISPVFFLQDSFTEFVLAEITERAISPDQVILEITEDIFITNFDTIKFKVMELRKAGVKISLDDFGTGYSSLNYLASIHFDEIKIDKAFIDYLATDAKAFSLLRSIVEVARIFDYKIVAEGVETTEQLDKLAEAGCQIIQGYLYSRPEAI